MMGMTDQAVQHIDHKHFLVPIEIWRPTFLRRLRRVLDEIERQAGLAQARALPAGTGNDHLTHYRKDRRRIYGKIRFQCLQTKLWVDWNISLKKQDPPACGAFATLRQGLPHPCLMVRLKSTNEINGIGVLLTV